MVNYKFCPKCGEALVVQDIHGEPVPVCTSRECGFHFWQNSKPCATNVIENDHGQLMFGIRSIEPDKGKLDCIGGFLREGEDPRAGAMREAFEELGVHISNPRFLGIVTDRYEYDGVNYWTLNIGYISQLKAGEIAAHDDISGVEWVDPTTVDRTRLAFTNNQRFLAMYLDLKHLTSDRDKKLCTESVQ